MSTQTQQDIEQLAYQIWQDYGRPFGREEEIWFEAERRLAAEAKSPDAETVLVPESHTLSEAQSDHALAEAAAQQRKQARAPILPHKTAPKPVPAATGKPLWSQPHSA